MLNTAELVERAARRAAREVAESSSSSKKSWAILAEIDGAASSKLRGVRVTGDWSPGVFGKQLLKKFPEGQKQTSEVLEKQVWERFSDEVLEADTADDSQTKKLFRGSSASYVWYGDLLEWYFFDGDSVKKLSEVAK